MQRIVLSSLAAVLPVGGVQQRRVADDRESDSRAAAEDPLSVLEDRQGADGHPDQRAPPHVGGGVQPPAERFAPETCSSFSKNTISSVGFKLLNEMN